MNKVIVITVIIAFAILIAVIVYACCRAASQEDRYLESVEHVCKYNDIKGCYERCCKFCNARHVCKRVCSNDPGECGGYSFEKRTTKVEDMEDWQPW